MTLSNFGNLVVALASFGFAAGAQQALAHDVWLTLRGDAGNRRAVINYGHPDDRPPAFADKVVDLFEIKSGEKISLLSGLTATVIDGTFVVEIRQGRHGSGIALADGTGPRP
jgi:hypothetical protein